MTVPPVRIAMSSEHRLAAIAEARRLHRRDLQAPAQLVHHQRGKRLALDVLGDDQQRLAGLYDALQQRQNWLQAGQLLLVDQDVRIGQLGDHLLGVGDEVGRDVAAVELHALNDFELGLDALRLFDRDDAFVADLLHGFRDHFADLDFAVRGDRTDLCGFGRRGDLPCPLLQLVHNGTYRTIDAPLEVHRVHASGHRLGALADDRLGENGRRRGAVTSDVARLGRDLAHHLGAHVFELVAEFDLLGDGHPVLADPGSAEALVEHHIAPLWAKCDFHCIGENVHTVQHPLARIAAEPYVLGCHCQVPPVS